MKDTSGAPGAAVPWRPLRDVMRYACRDSNVIGADDPPADLRWTWYALTWGDAVCAAVTQSSRSWRSRGAAAAGSLRAMVALAVAVWLGLAVLLGLVLRLLRSGRAVPAPWAPYLWPPPRPVSAVAGSAR